MKNIVLRERIISSEMDKSVESYNINLIRYKELKRELFEINKKTIFFYKIATIKILKEIRDKKYYELDGCKSFKAFAESYTVPIGRRQIYSYLKIALAMEKGILEENFIIENGINRALMEINNQDQKKLNETKSKKKKLKKINFSIEKGESYFFYKKNKKFLGILMCELFKKEKNLIEKIIEKQKINANRDNLNSNISQKWIHL